MTLRKILEELHPHQIGFGEDKVDIAHQQILALIPKKYDIDKMKHGAVVSNTWREEGFNEAVDMMEQSMIGE